MADTRPPSLLQRFTRVRRAVREPEPADLGTAFGLEQTVADTTWSVPAASEPPARAGWWRRWTARTEPR